MKFDQKFFQRLFLAFTTGLFLSCAARVSYVQAGQATAADAAAASR